MPALTIRITEDARSALQDLAQAECRSPRDQAAFLVIEGLRAATTSRSAEATPRRQGRPPRMRVAVAKAER
jgi:hypothetical protein